MNLLFQFISKWTSIVVLFCLFVLFNILLGAFLPKEYALDLMFAYSPKDAHTALGHLDMSQQANYAVGIWALDMPYIGVYFLFFSGLLIKVWKYNKVVLLPAAIAVADLFENLSVLRILALFPHESEILAVIASFFTTSKWVLIGILAVSMVVGVLLRLFFGKYSKGNSAGVRI